MKTTIATIVGVLGLFALLFVLQLAGVANFKFFGAKHEEAKREIFQESKQYQHGVIQDLDRMYLEYTRTSDPAIKGALESRARRLTAEFPKENLPKELRDWVSSIK